MRVIVGDDSLLTREGIVQVLTRAGMEVVATAGDASTLLAEVSAQVPDAVVIDVRMPPTYSDEGIIAAQQILSELPGVAVLVLSQYVDAGYALRLLDERPDGVGYLLKDRVSDPAILIDALRRLADGESVIDPTIVKQLVNARVERSALPQLSAREREVLGLVAEGLSNQAIAARLFITERTVEAHITRLLPKLELPEGPDVHRRVLAALAYVQGSRG